MILDLEFEEGLLFLVLENIGSRPAHSVRVRFAEPLRGLGGEKRIDRLRIFRRLELLGPRRRIRIFLDRAALFFARDEPTALEARIAWRTDEDERRSRTVRPRPRRLPRLPLLGGAPRCPSSTVTIRT